jgi:hypothetical protein
MRLPFFALAAALAIAASTADGATLEEQDRALAVAREAEQMAGTALWPGFEPLGIPLAIYTGRHTYLFRHPSPPEGFSRLPDAEPAAWVLAGRHPAVTSNSSAEIGGTVTATLLADGERADQNPTALAATALHESFHVHQRTRHATWAGNEGDLFLFPIDDPRLLALRRLETASLRRALLADDAAETACWARRALQHRAERFAAMDSAFSTYERRTELNEGLATYVQHLAGGTRVQVPAADFEPGRVRDRAYVTGPALGFLLDRLSPGWQAHLEANDDQHLDRMLEAAVRAPGPAPCAIDTAEVAAIVRDAAHDAAGVVHARTERRRRFDATPGWRVIVEAADGRPLWPRGFDPLNVERVDGGILHTRFLQLGNDAGELHAIAESGTNIEALTEAAGVHPLFNGVRRAVIAGLPQPAIVRDGEQVRIRAAGMELRFSPATVETRGAVVVLRVMPG